MTAAMREAAGLRQGELAGIIGVSRHVLGRWERGESTPDGSGGERYDAWLDAQGATCRVIVWDKTAPLPSLRQTERACGRPRACGSHLCAEHEADRARLAVTHV